MEKNTLPVVSVLVAARNEAANIRACLDALLNQGYPKDRFEVWIGDDQSEDETAAIVRVYSGQYPNIHLLQVNGCLKHQRGKSNVLAQLAHEASGEFLFVTDADMTVVPSWISCMLTYFTSEVGIITGVTAVTGKSLFAKFQNAEWLFYTGQGHLSARKGRPATAMGNNMAVSTSAYWQTGGYENIPFSVTEDYELYREIVKKGFKFKTVFENRALGFTQPQPTFRALLEQRKRWFTGAMRLPKPLVIGLVFLWVFLPVVLLTGIFFGWRAAAVLFILKWLLDTGFLVKIYRDIGLTADIGVWLYTPYSMVCNIIFLTAQLIPGPVEWKGRKYARSRYPGDQ